MKLIKKFENYMSREEMYQVLCKCGYAMSELEKCSTQELAEMCSNSENQDAHDNVNTSLNNTMSTQESKKWIQETKMKKGALHKQLGYKQDEKIPTSVLNKIVKKDIGEEVKVKGEDKKVTNLLKKRATLAKTLKGLKEHQTSNNYMFFANLETMQRYIDAIMELPKEEVDSILSEHDWASDHISVACENLEHVHNFLLNHEDPHSDHQNVEQEPMVKSFQNFKQ